MFTHQVHCPLSHLLIPFHLIFCNRVSHWTQGHGLAKLARKLWRFPSVQSTRLQNTHYYFRFFFLLVLGILTQVLILAQQEFHWLSHLPSTQYTLIVYFPWKSLTSVNSSKNTLEGCSYLACIKCLGSTSQLIKEDCIVYPYLLYSRYWNYKMSSLPSSSLLSNGKHSTAETKCENAFRDVLSRFVSMQHRQLEWGEWWVPARTAQEI